MTSAHVLAGELARAGADYQAAFTNHDRRLRPPIRQKQRSARSFARYCAPRTRAGPYVRDEALRIMRVPLLSDWLVARGLRDDITLPACEI